MKNGLGVVMMDQLGARKKCDHRNIKPDPAQCTGSDGV